MKKVKNSEPFSEVEHKHVRSVTSFDYVHVRKSIIYVSDSDYGKAPINKLSRSKTQRTSEKKTMIFQWPPTGILPLQQ